MIDRMGTPMILDSIYSLSMFRISSKNSVSSENLQPETLSLQFWVAQGSGRDIFPEPSLWCHPPQVQAPRFYLFFFFSIFDLLPLTLLDWVFPCGICRNPCDLGEVPIVRMLLLGICPL